MKESISCRGGAKLLLASAALLVLGSQAWAQEVTVVLPDEPPTLEACQTMETPSGAWGWATSSSHSPSAIRRPVN